MKLENQVCALDQAKRLYELGAAHFTRALFCWNGGSLVLYKERHLGLETFAAFTSAELGEMLGSEIITELEPGIEMHVWHCRDEVNYEVAFPADTEAQAKADMLIWLLEKGHRKPEEVNAALAAN